VGNGGSAYQQPGNRLLLTDNGHTIEIASVNGVLNAAVDGGAFTPIGGGAFAATTEGGLITRSASLLGTTNLAEVFDEFDTIALASNWNVSGAWVQSTTIGPGVWGMPSSATNVIQRSAGQAVWVANPSVTPWHIAVRFKLAVAVVAGDVKGAGFSIAGAFPALNACYAGIFQSVSATKFVFTARKAGVSLTALSTVNIDTNFHVLEIWFDGVSMWGSVDNETPVLVTTAASVPIVPMAERHGVEAGTGAAVEQFIDFTYATAGRTTS
jgi:hypothetical protein